VEAPRHSDASSGETDLTKPVFRSKRRRMSYLSATKELAERLNRHGLEETETSITDKLARGTFAASFFLACLAALEREGVRLEDI
jgi:hypothetical protein